MTPNLASIGMCCIFETWLIYQNETCVCSTSTILLFLLWECVSGLKPTYRQMTLYCRFWACWCTVTYIWRDTNTWSYKHAREGMKSSRLLRIIHATAGWYVGNLSLSPSSLIPVPAQSKRCSTLFWMCSTFLLWGKLMTQSLALQQPAYKAPVVSQTNETRKAGKELVMLRLATSVKAWN